MILELDEARARFPHAEFTTCEDPRHNDGDDGEAVAVVETQSDVYAVCDACLAAIQSSR